jgi:hypothetical protein
VTGDWRDFRPAIWLAMLGVAVALLFSPWYFGAIFLGAAIGAAIRIHQRRRRIAAANAATRGRAETGSRGGRQTAARSRRARRRRGSGQR